MTAPRVFPLLLVLACATSESATKQEPKPTKRNEAPTGETSNEELAAAWDETPQEKQAPKRPPPEPLPPDRSAAFKDALREGSAALKAGKHDDARPHAQRAVSEAAKLDGEARAQAGQLAFKLEFSANDFPAAKKAALAWRNACGPERAESCRSQATAALTQLAKQAKTDKALTKLAADAIDDEACLAKAQKSKKPLPCEAAAMKRAKAQGDGWWQARLLLARADDDEKKLEKVVSACTAAVCAATRRQALASLLRHAKTKGDAAAALRHALRDAAIAHEGLTEDERRYVRPAALDQACAAYDKANKPGACRAEEKQTLGYWTFRDFSREKPKSDGLTADQVKAVFDNYAPLLQSCLLEQAKRMTPPDAARFETRWVVFNDGRAGDAHLRRDQDDWPLADCLRAQFRYWRYPRFNGEYQHVEQTFTVHANEWRERKW